MNRNLTAEPRITQHVINLDFRNTIGQRVYVLDCPFFNTTVAVADSPVCTCGETI